MIKPVNENLLIQIDREAEVTAKSGIITRTASQKPPVWQAKVLCVDVEVKIAKKGDTILVGSDTIGKEYDRLERKYFIDARDILAVIS